MKKMIFILSLLMGHQLIAGTPVLFFDAEMAARPSVFNAFVNKIESENKKITGYIYLMATTSKTTSNSALFTFNGKFLTSEHNYITCRLQFFISKGFDESWIWNDSNFLNQSICAE